MHSKLWTPRRRFDGDAAAASLKLTHSPPFPKIFSIFYFPLAPSTLSMQCVCTHIIRTDMTLTKFESQIVRMLKVRKDIWLDDAVSQDPGAPRIRGIKLKRVKETEVRGPESYHPFTYTGWLYYGQSFAIETDFSKSKNPLSNDQLDWMDKFARVAGQYIEVRSLQDVDDALGKEEPQPWSEYEMRVTKIK